MNLPYLCCETLSFAAGFRGLLPNLSVEKFAVKIMRDNYGLLAGVPALAVRVAANDSIACRAAKELFWESGL